MLLMQYSIFLINAWFLKVLLEVKAIWVTATLFSKIEQLLVKAKLLKVFYDHSVANKTEIAVFPGQ